MLIHISSLTSAMDDSPCFCFLLEPEASIRYHQLLRFLAIHLDGENQEDILTKALLSATRRVNRQKKTVVPARQKLSNPRSTNPSSNRYSLPASSPLFLSEKCTDIKESRWEKLKKKILFWTNFLIMMSFIILFLHVTNYLDVMLLYLSVKLALVCCGFQFMNIKELFLLCSKDFWNKKKHMVQLWRSQIPL